MYSFYGGKQGHSYKIVAHYNSIYDMVRAFQGGGAYTAVNYDEYVIIDTVIERNQKNNLENGILYRRGYNFSEEFNPSAIPLNDANTTLSPNQLTVAPVTLFANEYGVEYEYGTMDSGVYSVSARVPKYKDFNYILYNDGTYEILVSENGFHTDQWNDDWRTFVEHPGGGAEYIGQIVGPEGATSSIEIISWDDLRDYRQSGEGTAEEIKGSVMADPRPGYDPAAAGTEGYDADGFHDKDQYAYCTLRDVDGNVTGSYIAFDIPYTVFTFEAQSIDPYDTTYGTYDDTTETWSYQGLISEGTESIGHPYYKSYHIKVPKGIHGKDIDSLQTKYYNADDPIVAGRRDNIENGQWLTYKTKTYNDTGEPIASAEIPIDPYKVISSIEILYRGASEVGPHTYPFQTIFHYTYGSDTVLDLNSIDKIWRQEETSGNLLVNHIYALMANSDVATDLGLVRQVYSIEKDPTDLNFYTYYTDDTAEERLANRTIFPVTEIEQMKLRGDLVLIRYKNVPDSFYTNSGVPTYTDPTTNKIWFNLGSCIKGNHIYTNFATYEDLVAAYPYGLGYTSTGAVDPTTQERMGWNITVGSDNNYSTYAYDYINNGWYKMQDLGASSIKPLYTMLVAPANQQDLPDSLDAALLQENGYWFVASE